MLPSSVRTRPTAVGRLSLGIPVFTSEPLQFEATTVAQAHHPRVLHDDQDQRAACTFRDLETDRRARDDRVRVDHVVHVREPVPHSGAVHRSTHHPLGTGCRQPQARREHQRRGTRAQYCCVKEKCSFESKGMVNPVVIPKCVARSSRNCCEEVTGGTSLVHHEAVEMAREAAGDAFPRDLLHAQRVPCPQWSATNRRRWNSRARASWPR